MAGLLDFLSALFKPKEGKDPSVVVKNYISGNNNQNHANGNGNQGSPGRKPPEKPKAANTKNSTPHTGSKSGQPSVSVKSIRLYSTGAKGKVYTSQFYKALNHNFGVEIVLVNQGSQPQTVSLGHCIYNAKGDTVIKGNYSARIGSHSTHTEYIYVKPQTFHNMKTGKYKSQVWLNDKRMQKVYFTITNK